jgi:ABC-2 type transport system permease protein
MIRRVLSQEWIFLRSSRIWQATLVTLITVSLIAALVGGLRVSRSNEVSADLNAQEILLKSSLQSAVARYEANPAGDPPTMVSPGVVGLSLLGHYAARPSPAFAPLAVGQSDLESSYYRVTAHSDYTFFNATEIANPLNLSSGSFDFAFVLVFLLPVFIVALTFDLLSREKEQGTLGLVLAHGISVQAFAAAKMLSRAILLTGLIVIINLVAMFATGADLGDPRTLQEALLWIGISVLYGLVWFAIAMLVNTMDWASVTNGVVLANVWLVFVVVLPAFTNIGALWLYPPPSRVELTTELRQASKEVEEEAAEAREEYYFDHPELAGDNANPDAFYLQVLATESAVEAAIEPTLEQFVIQSAAQEAVIDQLKYLSPAVLAQRSLTAISGTSRPWFKDFDAQVLSFHGEWREYFAGRIRRGEPLSAADFDSIPDFDYQRPPARFLMTQVYGPAAGLAAMFLIIGFIGIRKAARYPAI